MRNLAASLVIQECPLLQVGGGDEPFAAYSFAVGLPGSGITRKGVEQVSVVLNLTAVAR